jgi:hypothetical protein
MYMTFEEKYAIPVTLLSGRKQVQLNSSTKINSQYRIPMCRSCQGRTPISYSTPEANTDKEVVMFYMRVYSES